MQIAYRLALRLRINHPDCPGGQSGRSWDGLLSLRLPKQKTSFDKLVGLNCRGLMKNKPPRGDPRSLAVGSGERKRSESLPSVCCFVLLEPTPKVYRAPRVSPGVTAPSHLLCVIEKNETPPSSSLNFLSSSSFSASFLRHLECISCRPPRPPLPLLASGQQAHVLLSEARGMQRLLLLLLLTPVTPFLPTPPPCQ